MKILGREARARRPGRSLKVRTWRFFLLLLSAFCVIFVTSYSIIMARTAFDNELKSSELAMTGVGKNIRVSLDRYREMSRLIMLNSEVTEFLRESGSGRLYNSTQVRNAIFSITNIYNYVDSVYIYRLDGAWVRTGGGVMRVNERLINTTGWNKPLQDARGGATLMINGGGAFIKDSGPPLITIARHIYNVDTQRKLGLLVVNLSTSVLGPANKDFAGSDRPICYFDREGNYLWGDERLRGFFSSQYVGKGFSWKEIDGDAQQILSVYSNADTPIVQISVSDVPAAGMQSPETIWIAVILIAAVVLSVFSSGAFVSINVARPIEHLTHAMTNTKTNGLLQKTDSLALPDNEIRSLAETYNRMIDHINRLITELIEKEKSIQRAEMRVLHEQIKPHFLYNSIETISYMALQSNAPKVHDALETLGSFYRNFLSKGSREIPLINEILIVKDYLVLQKLRYGDVFYDEYDVEDGVRDTLVPKLILQPLAENSLNHGIRLKGERGVIRIRAFEKDGSVHISVYDSGVGMTREKIEEVLSGEAEGDDALSGFGLKGTIDRIRYYCNHHEVIEIRSEPGEFTEIEIILPKTDKRGEANV